MKTEKRHDFSNIKIAWWGWEDSNLQPNDYQPLALSIDQRPACGISWLRANSFKRKLYDAVYIENLDPAVMVMKSTQNRV